MTYTKNLRTFGKELGRLREALTAADDELLELRDREKRLAEIEDESTADVAEQYGMEN